MNPHLIYCDVLLLWVWKWYLELNSSVLTSHIGNTQPHPLVIIAEATVQDQGLRPQQMCEAEVEILRRDITCVLQNKAPGFKVGFVHRREWWEVGGWEGGRRQGSIKPSGLEVASPATATLLLCSCLLLDVSSASDPGSGKPSPSFVPRMGGSRGFPVLLNSDQLINHWGWGLCPGCLPPLWQWCSSDL